MEHPGVEREPEPGEHGQARPEVRPLVDVRPVGHRAVADDVARVPRRRVPHPAEAPATGAQMRLQHRLHAVAQGEIREAHDAGGDPRGPVHAARAHRGLAGHELGLAHRPHLHGPGRAVHRVAFEEHGGDQVVAGRRVREEVGQEVAVALAVPQVVMRVDDRQLGLEDGLGRLRGQPRLVRMVDPAELGRTVGCAHAESPRVRSRVSLARSAGKKHSTRSSCSVMS